MTTAPINQTKRERRVVTNTFKPFAHFFGNLGGMTFQEGMKRMSVASIPNKHATTESILSFFESVSVVSTT